jgi:hypothetical protein
MLAKEANVKYRQSRIHMPSAPITKSTPRKRRTTKTLLIFVVLRHVSTRGRDVGRQQLCAGVKFTFMFCEFFTADDLGVIKQPFAGVRSWCVGL